MKKAVLKILQYSQEKTPLLTLLFNKAAALKDWTLLKTVFSASLFL